MDCKVLVLGAGGLGCELLKNLAMLKVREVHVIDMDTISLTNLNRQFLFRDSDIGESKALVAARYINSRHGSDTRVVPHHADLTTLVDVAFLQQFQFVISGLDAVEPRRHVNDMLVRLTRESHFETCVPLIDGGVEGLRGHVKTIVPGITACWECSMATLPAEGSGHSTVPMCTIANNPRTLEHVIEHVLVTMSGDSGADADADDSATLQRLLDKCHERAQQFGIDDSLLTLSYMVGVMRRVIPSVSTMNAVIAAQCCNELVKIFYDVLEFTMEDQDKNTTAAFDNFTLINGTHGEFVYGFHYRRDEQCSVCRDLF